MFYRARTGLLALSLVALLLPLSLMAAPRGRRGFRGHGFGGGHSVRQGHIGGSFRFGRPGRGFTGFRGFGRFRHGGLGFGFHAGHIRSRFRIRSFHRPRIYGYPYGYAYPYWSYYSYGYSNGIGYGLGGVTTVGVPVVAGYASTAPSSPTVIIIQPEPQRPPVHMEAQPPLHQRRGPASPPPERPQREAGRSYYTRPPPVPQEPVQPQTLLVFKDRSVYSVAEYWKTADQLCYLNSYGVGKCVPVDELDLAFTKKLNQGRNLKFELAQ